MVALYVCMHSTWMLSPPLGREIWEQTVDIWEQVSRERSNGMLYIGRLAAGYTYHTRVLYIDVNVQEEEGGWRIGNDECTQNQLWSHVPILSTYWVGHAKICIYA